MNTWNTPSRPRCTRWSITALGSLTLSTCLGVAPPVVADSPVEQCLLSGHVTRIDAEGSNRLLHVSFSQPRAPGAAPCFLGRSSRTQNVRFSVPGHSYPKDIQRGARVEYRYTRFPGGETSWEPSTRILGPEQ